jgi:pyruvate dehydrogenase E1 component beta subunit
MDEDLLLESVKKTGRLVVADGGWKTCGVGAELVALVAEKLFGCLKAPVRRISLPDAPAPASSVLEKLYYPGAEDIISAVKRLLLWRKPQ